MRVMIADLQAYVDSTYDEHYSQNKYQATEFIIDAGHGEGFCLGNILKYTQRYGKKGKESRRFVEGSSLRPHCTPRSRY